MSRCDLPACLLTVRSTKGVGMTRSRISPCPATSLMSLEARSESGSGKPCRCGQQRVILF
jgi:hypothetical protein